MIMTRANTTSDTFNAVAEPRRREIFSDLARAERPVGERLWQRSASSSLPSLSTCGCCAMWVGSDALPRPPKLYRTNAETIRPLLEWAGTFERYWQDQFNRVKERAEAIARQTQQR